MDGAGMRLTSRGDADDKLASNDSSTSGRGGCSSDNSKSKSNISDSNPDSESNEEQNLDEPGRGGCSRDKVDVDTALTGVEGSN